MHENKCKLSNLYTLKYTATCATDAEIVEQSPNEDRDSRRTNI